MTLLEYMRTHTGEEDYDEITVHDEDYDTEFYFYPEDENDEKWDKAMHELAEALTVISIEETATVVVNFSELVEGAIDRINSEKLFNSEESVDSLMLKIHLILAGNVPEDWFADYFVPALTGGKTQ